MNGVHDMGGLECFGPVKPETNEPIFHHEWEKRVLAVTLAVGATGEWNIDQSRHSRECLPPADYLSIGYYRIWLAALENLLVEHKLLSKDEIATGKPLSPAKLVSNKLQAENVQAVLSAGTPYDRDESTPAKFSIGDVVRIKNLHTTTHTRLPGYIRGAVGEVHRIHGCHVFPDSNSLGRGDDPKWLYNIKFHAQDLWGNSRQQSAYVHVDCWEPYLANAEQQS